MRALAKLQAELAKARPRGVQPLAMAAVMLAKQADEMTARTGWATDADVSAEQAKAQLEAVLDAIEPRVAGDD